MIINIKNNNNAKCFKIYIYRKLRNKIFFYILYYLILSLISLIIYN